MDDREMSRLADAAAALRPDWSARSVRAFLAKHVASKAYADVAVALTVLAVQSGNETPRLLAEYGPWWKAAEVGFRRQTADVGPGRDAVRCDRPGHEYEAAQSCRACASERLTGTDSEPPPPMRPAPPPPEVVRVAERHRARGQVANDGTVRREFAQPQELAPPTNDVRGCDSCGALYVPGTDGEQAHRIVFGHSPSVKTESEAS